MELKKIKDLIIKAKEKNATTLDLSFKKLSSLPPEIAELKNLTELDISANQLTSMPPDIAELKNLFLLSCILYLKFYIPLLKLFYNLFHKHPRPRCMFMVKFLNFARLSANTGNFHTA